MAARLFLEIGSLSLGGCFVETSAILQAGKPLTLVFSIDDGKLQAEGSVLRIDPGTGIAIQFNDMDRANRERIPRILEFVQNAAAFYDNRYLAELRRNQ